MSQPDSRRALLQEWLQHHFAKQRFTLQPITGDASFRRYFRVQCADQSYIAMDAPPERENCLPFVAIAQAFLKLGVQVPQIFASDLVHGFLLLSDLGDDLLLGQLNDTSVTPLYNHALDVIDRIQTCKTIENWDMPHFGAELILREWRLYTDWAIARHWGLETSVQEQYLLSATYELLLNSAAAQPQVCVHRDYHSRNLLQLSDNNIGVLDFQDAVWGPITYDAISLLRDCYIDWPRDQVQSFVARYYEQVRDAGHIKQLSLAEFTRFFDLMGVQRHLKVLGIFTRLNYLYERPNYLQYIPRILHYLLEVCADYPELNDFAQFLQRTATSTNNAAIIL